MRRKEVESVEAGNVGNQRTNESPRVMLHPFKVGSNGPASLHHPASTTPHFEDAVDAPCGILEGFINGTQLLAISRCRRKRMVDQKKADGSMAQDTFLSLISSWSEKMASNDETAAGGLPEDR